MERKIKKFNELLYLSIQLLFLIAIVGQIACEFNHSITAEENAFPAEDSINKIVLKSNISVVDINEAGTLAIIIAFSFAPDQDTNISWSIPGGEFDFSSSSGVLTVLEGEESKVITITPIDDEIYEVVKSYSLAIQGENEFFENTLTLDVSLNDDDSPLGDPSFTISSGLTGSSSESNQMAVVISTGNDAVAVKWCLSETQSTRPINGICNGGEGLVADIGWLTSSPTSINLSSGEGPKTIYLWILDSSNNVNSNPITSTINFDSQLPATPTVEMTDTLSASNSNTYSGTVDLGITNDTDAVKWCIIEQDGVTAPPLKPLWNDICFVSPKPTQENLDSLGDRKIYLFTQDVAANISDIPSIHQINYAINQSPATNSETRFLMAGDTITLLLIDVMANDSDPEGESFSITGSTNGASGTVTVNSGTTLTYQISNAVFYGQDSFTYTVTDVRGASKIENVYINIMTTFTWIGNGGNSTWSTATNWCGTIKTDNTDCDALGVAPGASDVAVFDNTCSLNCDANINAAISVLGIDMAATYAGTLTQDSGGSQIEVITIGLSGWKNLGGTFAGGDSTIDLNGDFSMGGTAVFTSTSGFFYVGYYKSYNANGFMIPSGTFNHNSGTVHFNGYLSTSTQSIITTTTVDVASSVTFNDLEVKVSDTNPSGGRNQTKLTIGSGDTVTVLGNLTVFDGEISGGNIDLYGNLDYQCADGPAGSLCAGGGISTIDTPNGGGTTNLRLVGPSNTTYSFESGAITPRLHIAKDTSLIEVSAAPGTTDLHAAEFYLTTGTFNAPTGIFSVGANLGWGASANIDGFTVTSTGIFNHNNGTLEFSGLLELGGHSLVEVMTVDVDSNLTVNDLILNMRDAHSSGSSYNHAKLKIASGDTITVLGDLIGINGEVWGGTIDVKGNLDFQCADGVTGDSCYGTGPVGTDGRNGGGTTLIRLTGGGTQTYAYESGATLPPLVIATTGTVEPFAGTTELKVAEFTLESGTFVAPSGTLYVGYDVGRAGPNNDDGFKVSGGTFTHSNGTLVIDASTHNNTDVTVLTFDILATLTLNNLTIATKDTYSNDGYANGIVKIATGKTIILDGDLIVEDGRINGGTIEVLGDVNFSYTNASTLAEGGTTAITLNNALLSQNITQISGAIMPNGQFTIDNSNGVNLLTPLVLSGEGHNFYILDGVMNMDGFNLTGIDDLFMNVGTSINKAGGLLDYTNCTGPAACPIDDL